MTNKKTGILERDSFYIALLGLIVIAFCGRLLFTDQIIRASDVITQFFWGAKGVKEQSLLQFIQAIPGIFQAGWDPLSDGGRTLEGGWNAIGLLFPPLPYPALLSLPGQHRLAGGSGHVLGKRRDIQILPSDRCWPLRCIHGRAPLRPLYGKCLPHQRRTYPETRGDMLGSMGNFLFGKSSQKRPFLPLCLNGSDSCRAVFSHALADLILYLPGYGNVLVILCRQTVPGGTGKIMVNRSGKISCWQWLW